MAARKDNVQYMEWFVSDVFIKQVTILVRTRNLDSFEETQVAADHAYFMNK